jgi:hypothetical protein
MYPTTILLYTIAFLVAAADASVPTRSTHPVHRVLVHPPVDKYTTNAKRLAMGVAPAPPSSMRRRSPRDLFLRPTRRGQGNPAKPSSTAITPLPVCVVTKNAVPLLDDTSNVDDQFVEVDLSFKVQMYDKKSKSVFISTNGVCA